MKPIETLFPSQWVDQDAPALDLAGCLKNSAYIRVVNYHSTRPVDAGRFEREVAAFRKNFAPVTTEMLDIFFETRVWPGDKPGLIPAVYEGWRENYDVFAKILDQYEFRGWFYVPAFFPDVPIAEQEAYCLPHGLYLHNREDYSDPRCCMTWDELRALSRNHEICCHTGNHFRIAPDTPAEKIRLEVVDSKHRLEEMLQKEVTVFCWNKGEEYKRVPYSHKFFREAGYCYVVSNLKLERIR